MITRTLAGLVLAAQLVAGLLPTRATAPPGADVARSGELPGHPEEGPAIHLLSRVETAAIAAIPRGCDRIPGAVRRIATDVFAVEPPAPSRLTFCVELTKPAYLKLRLASTPQSYRSPPA